MMKTSSGVIVAKAQPMWNTLMQVLSRQTVVGQHNIGAYGVTVAKAQARWDTLIQVLSSQSVVEQHNIRYFRDFE
jgi:hypothetical protein